VSKRQKPACSGPVNQNTQSPECTPHCVIHTRSSVYDTHVQLRQVLSTTVALLYTSFLYTPSPMSLATRRRPDTSNPSDGSRTITVHDSQPREEDSGSGTGPSNTEPIGSLHLRGGEAHGRRVMWTDDTVDNEGAGRKKSKSTSRSALY
jgi:hypothetical protein